MFAHRSEGLEAIPPSTVSRVHRGTSPSPARYRQEQDGPVVALPRDCSLGPSGHYYVGPDGGAVLFRAALHVAFGEPGDATTSSRTSFRHFEDQTDGLSQTLPACGFSFQLRLTFPRHAIELGLAPGLGRFPVGCQQAAVFEPVQCRIKRALRNLDHTARY